MEFIFRREAGAESRFVFGRTKTGRVLWLPEALVSASVLLILMLFVFLGIDRSGYLWATFVFLGMLVVLWIEVRLRKSPWKRSE